MYESHVFMWCPTVVSKIKSSAFRETFVVPIFSCASVSISLPDTEKKLYLRKKAKKLQSRDDPVTN